MGGWLAVALLVASGWAVLIRELPAVAQGRRVALPLAPSDTDSTAQARPVPNAGVVRGPSDTLRADTLQADSLQTASTSRPDTGRVASYVVPSPWQRPSLFPSAQPFTQPHPLQPQTVLDSAGGYVVDTYPRDGAFYVPDSTYQAMRLRAGVQANWQSLIAQRDQSQQDRAGFGVNLAIPGGSQSAFSTIFGAPQVDLRINGQANINAGFDYRKSDRQVAISGNASQLDPRFKQDLRLGITGTIGDKLRINVDWDTNSPFNYQNQLKLKYTGYEDEIIQSVEAGNVFLNTPSQLIRGGQSLFGLKGQFQFGDLTLTTVATQQEGQAQSLTIEGGAETSTFNLRPTDYDANAHFLLGYYFRNRWNDAHNNPPNVTLFDGFGGLLEIEVWKLQTRPDPDAQNVRRAVGMVDLAEPTALVEQADRFTQPVLPRPTADQYTDAEIQRLRDGDQVASTYLTSNQMNVPLDEQSFQEGVFRKLERGREYTVDERLGYLSLTQSLQPNEALAVAYRYTVNGQTVTVGDFAADQGGTTGGQDADRLVLKLLRPSNPVQPSVQENPAAWHLALRNIYRLNGRRFTPDNFQLDISYNPPGSGNRTVIPAVAGQTPLLRVFGFDALNQNNGPEPDNRFDFVPGFTIDPSNGLLIFPDLEPFGAHLADVIASNGGDPNGAAEQYLFRDLYRLKKENAQRRQARDVYRVNGEFRGATKQFYDLKAFAGIVEGSVEVTAGGTPLQEGTDYVVDYQGGTVTITNPAYLQAGRDIQIDYEQNSFTQVQKKTLLGARAEYAVGEKYALGATLMRLSEKTPADKFRIGEEPIKNTLWGVDGSMDVQPRWLTQAIDALPLVQTKAESRVQVSGEFAQFRPGYTRTEAYERTQNELQEAGEQFAPDERRGISYIDDFEGFENSFSLRQQLDAWTLSAPPVYPQNQPAGPQADSLVSNWRATLGWYQLNENFLETLEGQTTQRGPAEATEIVDVRDVFPDRDVSGQSNPTIRTLDLYFNPWQRGPYNFTTALGDFMRQPRRTWGGITRRIPEGYTDFTLQNVEFVEFIVKPYAETPSGSPTDEAMLYVNLGSISEDVVPNNQLNDEDGLSPTFSAANLDRWSRLPGGQKNTAIDVTGQRTEDLGLDGLVSYNPPAYATPESELQKYEAFVASLDQVSRAGLSAEARTRLDAAIARARRDPSGDDYHYFSNNAYFADPSFYPTTLYPQGATVQERFSRYYAGKELNSFVAQNELAQGVSVARGNVRRPDSEDLNFNSGVDFANDYYEYAVPLSRARLDALAQPRATDDYVVGKVGEGWYKVRIPVNNFTRKVGTIDGFSRIESIRLWTTGHAAPTTVRFAALELVGSQWRNSDAVAAEEARTTQEGGAELNVTSINNEEDPVYQPPLGAIVPTTRTASGGQQRSREQSLVVRVEDLAPNTQRGVFKTYSRALDLLKYSNLRMFVHAHGAASGANVQQRIRQNARLFVRLGSSETGAYYEYEQPLVVSPVPTGSETRSQLWPDSNAVNIRLRTLNQLKVARDRSGFPIDSVYASTQAPSVRLGDAPSGTVVYVKGTPSLRNINTVVIGLRHRGVTNAILDEINLWANELRVSGYDQSTGWAALSNMNVQMADFGTVRASFEQRTAGFGSLSSTLANRSLDARQNWTVGADVSLDKLLPKAHGWQMPVTMQMQSQTTTPTFDPVRGDVRVAALVERINALPDSSLQRQYGANTSPDALREQLRDSIRTAAQNRSIQRSLTIRVSKRNSESPWLQYTMDAIGLSFSYFDRAARSPQNAINDQWQWNGTFDYQLDFGDAATVKPFWFLGGVPVLGALGNVQFNYKPQSVSFRASANRSFSQTKSRSSVAQAEAGVLPDRLANPLRENQSFQHQRTFDLQYNPFTFLNLNVSTTTQQSLNDVGARRRTNLILVDSLSRIQNVYPNLTQEEALAQGIISQADIDAGRVFEEERLMARPEDEVFRDVFFGAASPRTNTYEQRLSATFTPTFLEGETFNWIRLDNIAYNASFDWQNASEGSATGATVKNTVDVQTGITLRPNKVWERFGFFERWKEAQRSSDAAEASPAPPDTAAADSTGFLADLPWPDPLKIARGVALTFMDVPNLSFTYNASRSARSSGVGRVQDDGSIGVDYSVLDALQGQGPSLGYRLGLNRRIDPSQRIVDSLRQTTDAFRNTNRFGATTTLTPSRNVRVTLDWSAAWSNDRTVRLRPLAAGEASPDAPVSSAGQPFARISTVRGQRETSVWSFGASYRDVFANQLQTLRASAARPATDTLQARATVLTNASAASAFRKGFVSGVGTVGDGFPLPLPGWRMSYTGLSRWPFVKRFVQQATISHDYRSTYTASYQSNPTAGAIGSVALGARTFQYVRPGQSVESARLIERFNPLIGLDLTWTDALQTSIEWNTTNEVALSTSRMGVQQAETSELSFSASFRKRGLQLPFFNRIQNTLEFSLNVRRAVTDRRRYVMRTALANALSDPSFTAEQALTGDNVAPLEQTTRLTVAPQISYRVSNRVQAAFQMEYVRLQGDSNNPSFTEMRGGFNVTVNISEN